jgi:hypothetical protein
MATVRDRLDSLPVAELAEVREKLRVNAEEREALEAIARRLLEAWGGVDTPPSPVTPPAPTAPPPVPELSPLAWRVASGDASIAEQAVWVFNSNLGKYYTAGDLGDLWNIKSEKVMKTIRSTLAKTAKRGWIRKVSHGRYTSIHST